MTVLTDDLVTRAAALLDTRVGLKPVESFRPRLARALRDVVRQRQLDPAALLAGIATDGAILDDVVDHITVQESGFFRHPEHFHALVDRLLPPINGPVHVWSAASANGQEAYSIAMVLREQGRLGSILATDVAPTAVRRTTAGRYAGRELSGVSERRLQQHFVRDGTDDQWQVQRSLRDMVEARRHNLLAPIPSAVAQCQIVFCRNVLIYFTAAHARLFLDRLADVMAPDAHLIVGSAETIWHINDRFEPVRLGPCYAYGPRTTRLARASMPEGTASSVPAPTAPTTARSVEAHIDAAAPTAARRRVRAPIEHPRRAATPERDRPGPPESSAAAVIESRRWAYDEPDDPIAHLHLATALEQSGHPVAARRAFRAALGALDRRSSSRVADDFDGYASTELRRLLIAKSGQADLTPSCDPTNTDERGTT